METTDEQPIDSASLHRRLKASRGLPAFLRQRTADELISRLEYLTLQPQCIVELGATDGALSQALSRQFPKASVIAVEPVQGLLDSLPKHRFWRRRRVQALTDCALDALPLTDQYADLIVANLSLTRFETPDHVLREVARVLKPDGVFLFAGVGPDTLKELRNAWASIDQGAHVARFLDMHDVGDAVGRAGLREPVLDVERLTVKYPTADKLWRDLDAAAARNVLASRTSGLTGRQKWRQFLANLTTPGQDLEISLEMIYGHSFGASRRLQNTDNGNIGIPIDSIGMRQR